MTPEGKTKKEIKKVLKQLRCWYYMPVPSGYGKPSLDFLCCVGGLMFAVEAKAPGKKMTPRQLITAEEMLEYGIPSFCCDGDNIEELTTWIMHIA